MLISPFPHFVAVVEDEGTSSTLVSSSTPSHLEFQEVFYLVSRAVRASLGLYDPGDFLFFDPFFQYICRLREDLVPHCDQISDQECSNNCAFPDAAEFFQEDQTENGCN